jgi:exosome complex exonuclease DIS3/RRP44
VRTIGRIGDRAAENEVIVLEHSIIVRPFSADVIACLPPADWRITPENSAGRIDVRGVDVCSIDPPGCKDIDDALHARVLPAGSRGLGGEPGAPSVLSATGQALESPALAEERVEVGVHIADVGFFVKEGTAIDVEAAERANTTYLVEKRLDMLPGLLTETLCSLKGGVERFAFSVTWEFRRVPASDPRCAPGGPLARLAPSDRWEFIEGSTRFFRAIIHSRAAMTYAAAQAFLDDPTASGAVPESVRLLASIARCLRRQRIEAGALSLASPEVKFLLEPETADPLDVSA